MARLPIHPGETLAGMLDDYTMSAARAARILDVPTNRITRILAGRRNIIAATAMRPGRWLRRSPQVRMNLQPLDDRRLAQRKVGEEIERSVTPRASVPEVAA